MQKLKVANKKEKEKRKSTDELWSCVHFVTLQFMQINTIMFLIMVDSMFSQVSPYM